MSFLGNTPIIGAETVDGKLDSLLRGQLMLFDVSAIQGDKITALENVVGAIIEHFGLAVEEDEEVIDVEEVDDESNQ